MSQKLYIPETIHIGFQKRTDTYTKSLGYVIYKDEKGKLRKETSWNSWRDKTIDPKEFKNEPTEGFVLNRNVGGKYTYSYQTRIEKVRVYDPRGFEFEIAIPNLLHILQECTSTKGKGLEGKFVYSWNGTELVLLPVESELYKECEQFTALTKKTFSTKDLKEGHTYIDKYSNQYLYLGRFDWYDIKWTHTTVEDKVLWGRINCTYNKYVQWRKSRQHIFATLPNCRIICLSPNKLSEELSSVTPTNYAELVDEFLTSKESSYPIRLEYRTPRVKPTESDAYHSNRPTRQNIILKNDPNDLLTIVSPDYDYTYDPVAINYNYTFKGTYRNECTTNFVFDNKSLQLILTNYQSFYYHSQKSIDTNKIKEGKEICLIYANGFEHYINL